jgi:hypothetical protein
LIKLTCAICGQTNVSHKRSRFPCEAHCIGKRHQEAFTLFQTALNALHMRNTVDFNAATLSLANVRGGALSVVEVRKHLRELFAQGLQPNEVEHLASLAPSAPTRTRRGGDTGDAWLAGFAVALAEVHRLNVLEGTDSGLCRIANDAALTIAEARRVRVDEYDIERLKRAGLR